MDQKEDINFMADKGKLTLFNICNANCLRNQYDSMTTANIMGQISLTQPLS